MPRADYFRSQRHIQYRLNREKWLIGNWLHRIWLKMFNDTRKGFRILFPFAPEVCNFLRQENLSRRLCFWKINFPWLFTQQLYDNEGANQRICRPERKRLFRAELSSRNNLISWGILFLIFDGLRWDVGEMDDGKEWNKLEDISLRTSSFYFWSSAGPIKITIWGCEKINLYLFFLPICRLARGRKLGDVIVFSLICYRTLSS